MAEKVLASTMSAPKTFEVREYPMPDIPHYLYLHPHCVMHRVREHIPPAEAALFLPMSNGVEWMYRYGDLKLGDTVLVQGPGQQGLSAVLTTKEAGAACILATGLNRGAKGGPLAMSEHRRIGFGRRPALLLIDLYRWVFGDRPEPLLEAIKTWPGSCGLAAWQAIPPIQTLLKAARDTRIPIVHMTGLDHNGMERWTAWYED